MAYTRGLSTRASLLARRCHPSFSYLLHGTDDRRDSPVEGRPSLEKLNPFLQQRSFLSNLNGSSGLGAAFPGRSCSSFSSPLFSRYMSTVGSGIADKAELMSDVAEVLTETTVQAVASQAAAVNEVAIAAADSFYPVMYLQYLIDYVHQLSGLNWWASIAVTTLLIRTLTLPLVVNQMRASTKLAIIRPRMEEIKEEIDNSGHASATLEGHRKMKALFNEHGVSPFTPLKGVFIQGPVFISFFLAVSNMAEKVPSFKSGGAFWFTDLTTPDSLYVLPVLTGLSFLITVECNMQAGMEANPSSGTIKMVSRAMAVLTVPFTMSFPKAIFCYWITSNLFSLAYGFVIHKPGVKKFLGIPEMPVLPPSTSQKSAFDVFAALKRARSMTQESLSEPAALPSKLPDRKASSSIVLSQRLRSLEKEVKGRKKNKRR